MALETIRVSDKSHDPIPAGTGARIRVMFFDGKRADRRADLTEEEVAELLSFTVEVEQRGKERRSESDD